MAIHVIVVTKGRAAEVRTLVQYLGQSSVPPNSVVVVGASPADVAGVGDGSLLPGTVRVMVSDRPGSCIQRNLGIEYLRSSPDWDERDLVIFFDDDFRPDIDWLSHCQQHFEAQPDVIGLTGNVLADGVRFDAITEDQALTLIADWRMTVVTTETRTVTSLYGCNMALRGSVFATLRFDERLPFYGYLEDMDFSVRAKGAGSLVIVDDCAGVHLGVKAARISGKRFGYSQIMNPVYLLKKGTCSPRRTAFMLLRALASNSLRSIRIHRLFDYRGRLNGNIRAFRDIARGRIRPETIHDF